MTNNHSTTTHWKNCSVGRKKISGIFELKAQSLLAQKENLVIPMQLSFVDKNLYIINVVIYVVGTTKFGCANT